MQCQDVDPHNAVNSHFSYKSPNKNYLKQMPICIINSERKQFKDITVSDINVSKDSVVQTEEILPYNSYCKLYLLYL